jgi:hypothetical protein
MMEKEMRPFPLHDATIMKVKSQVKMAHGDDEKDGVQCIFQIVRR